MTIISQCRQALAGCDNGAMGDIGALSVSFDPSGNSRGAGGGDVGAEAGAGTDVGSDGHVHEGAGSGCGGDGDDADAAAVDSHVGLVSSLECLWFKNRQHVQNQVGDLSTGTLEGA